MEEAIEKLRAILGHGDITKYPEEIQELAGIATDLALRLHAIKKVIVEI